MVGASHSQKCPLLNDTGTTHLLLILDKSASLTGTSSLHEKTGAK
jgi:hypothetical protein